MTKLRGALTNLGKYNEGELVGEWVTFPIDEDEQEEIFARIGIDGEVYEEYFFTDWDSDIPGLTKGLGEYENIDGINEIAEALETIQDDNTLSAVLKFEDGNDILELIEDVGKYKYILLPAVNNRYDLGRYYGIECGSIEIPENIKSYFNFEAYGRDIDLDSYGMFTEWGWIEKND